MILYQIDTGSLTIHSKTFPDYIAYCYSGLAECKNKSTKVAVEKRGPIPPGTYKIGSAHLSPKSGPLTMNLTPGPGNVTYDRSGFEIHGDSVEHPGQASHGCIVASHAARLKIEAARASGDDILTVIP